MAAFRLSGIQMSAVLAQWHHESVTDETATARRKDSEEPGEQRVLAIDIGGTKLAAGVVDGTGRVLEMLRTPTPTVPAAPDGDAASPSGAEGPENDRGESIFAALLGLLGRLDVDRSRLVGVGIGCGGPMSWPDGRVSPLNIPSWREFPLRDRLREQFPGLPVHLHNDAICVAVAEHWLGAGRESGNMLGMVVSTGVGGGLILNGRLIDGSTGNAGHIGHVLVHPDEDPAEARCQCGVAGCLEAVASGPRLAAWAARRGWRADAPEDQRTGRDLVEDARSGDATALSALTRAGRALGIAIASATVLCDLELAAIGGGLAEAGPLLFDPLAASLRERVGLDFAQQIRAVPAALGRDVGLVGAAGLIYRSDRYWAAD
jgi:glucokinase